MVNKSLESACFTFTCAAQERLDKFLALRLPDFSRSRLKSLIQTGHVSINGMSVTKAGFLVRAPAEVEIRIPPVQKTDLVPEQLPLHIVYEDADVLVINKEAGMVVHPGAGHLSGTLVNAALAHDPHLEGIGGEHRPGIVHRLDKDTSGIILIAKNDATHRWLQNQFKSRTTTKTYLALVDGKPPSDDGLIDAPIGRDPKYRQRMAVVPSEKGRISQTRYRTLEKFRQHTLLEVKPLTGRTHQIRVHLRFLGCPVTGDTIYGRKKPSIEMERFFLHAYKLEIALFGQADKKIFTAPLPEDLESVLSQLRVTERIT